MTSETLDRIRREARVAGIRRVATPSLDQVEGRRLQLFALTAVVLVAMAAAIASAGRTFAPVSVPPAVLRIGVIALAVAFCAHTVEAEIHLRRLTGLLIQEQLRGVALQADVDRLLEADRVRSDVVRSVSHDLKTPLTGIIGSAELLSRADVPPAQTEILVGVIQRQAANLESMVDTLLAASALEREGPSLELRRVDLAPLVDEVCAEYRAAGVELSVELPADPFAAVLASEAGLRRVVTNLVRNAATHGRPPVRVSLRAEGEAWRLSVFDAGDGIPEADRRRAFELFSRLDPARSGPGLGLGLAIVAGLVGAWGGRVWIGDAPEGGAAVHLRLPRDPSAT